MEIVQTLLRIVSPNENSRHSISFAYAIMVVWKGCFQLIHDLENAPRAPLEEVSLRSKCLASAVSYRQSTFPLPYVFIHLDLTQIQS